MIFAADYVAHYSLKFFERGIALQPVCSPGYDLDVVFGVALRTVDSVERRRGAVRSSPPVDFKPDS